MTPGEVSLGAYETVPEGFQKLLRENRDAGGQKSCNLRIGTASKSGATTVNTIYEHSKAGKSYINQFTEI